MELSGLLYVLLYFFHICVVCFEFVFCHLLFKESIESLRACPINLDKPLSLYIVICC